MQEILVKRLKKKSMREKITNTLLRLYDNLAMKTMSCNCKTKLERLQKKYRALRKHHKQLLGKYKLLNKLHF